MDEVMKGGSSDEHEAMDLERLRDAELGERLHAFADRVNQRVGDATMVAQIRAVADIIMRITVRPTPPERVGAALRGERNVYEV